MFYRLGQAMVRLRYWVIGLWLVAALASIPFAPRVAQALSPGGFSSPDMQSQQAIDALQSGLHTNFTNVLVIFSSKTMTADDPRFIAEATAATARLQTWSAVSQIVPFTLDPSQVSRDRHTAFTSVFLKANSDAAPKELPALRQRVSAQPDLSVTIGGGPVFYADIQSVSEADLRRAETIAFPFALLALVLVFRSVVAAALPAIIGGCSVAISLALLYAIALRSPISIFALNITTLFGLGLGVDYSLFVVSRFREELRRGHSPPEAVAISMSTAGRAVFFSGLTVSIGLLGLVVFPLNMLHSVGLGGMLTVAFSIIAAVTLLPALLGVLGERVNATALRTLIHDGLSRRARLLARALALGHASPCADLATDAGLPPAAGRTVPQCAAGRARRLDFAAVGQVARRLRHTQHAVRSERDNAHRRRR
jgi:RND superfamily putative drug exporter